MAFNAVQAGNDMNAENVQQIIDAITGATGGGQAISLTQLNDSSSYALDLRNLDSTNSYALRARDESNNNILLAAKAAITFGKKIIATGLGTFTAAANMVDIAATWNNASDTFMGIKVNITNTASAAASRVLDIQVGGTSKFAIGTDGTLYDSGTAKGLVTNGDTHDHSGGDGNQIDHGGLAGLGDNDHTQYVLTSGSLTQITTRNHSDLTGGGATAAVHGLASGVYVLGLPQGAAYHLDYGTLGTSAGGTTQAFSKAFSSNPVMLVSETGSANWTPWADTITTTNFKGHDGDDDGGTITWIAIGPS